MKFGNAPFENSNLDQQLAGSQDEAGICVADAGCELTKSASIARVRVGAKQHFACKQRPQTNSQCTFQDNKLSKLALREFGPSQETLQAG